MASVDACVPLRAGAMRLELHSGGGGPPIPAVLVGSGRTTFVLTDESDESLCSWLPFVATLRAHGYSALLYDYLDPNALPAEVAAGARAAVAAGAQHVILMGASVGARASIEAAVSPSTRVAAAISLSAEQTVRSDPNDLARIARRVALPTLLISAREDPFVAGFTPLLLRSLTSRRKNALIIPGTDHGTALLSGAYGQRVQDTILAFAAASQ